MLVDDCGSGMGWTTASVRGGWSTPGGCRNSAMSFGGSVPSLHPTGSIRSLRSQHSMQVSCWNRLSVITSCAITSWLIGVLKILQRSYILVYRLFTDYNQLKRIVWSLINFYVERMVLLKYLKIYLNTDLKINFIGLSK